MQDHAGLSNLARKGDVLDAQILWDVVQAFVQAV